MLDVPKEPASSTSLAGTPTEAFAPVGAGDCCRTNSAMIFKTGNHYAATPNGCEAGCLSTATCQFFSHSALYEICIYCSACSLEVSRMSKLYTSWRRKAPPALPDASPSQPLLFTMIDRGATALLATQRVASVARASPPWLHQVVNLATPGSQRLGAVFNKFRALSKWLEDHPEV
jgi:hypothetical protein|tara:strand:- start:26 stop:550 length:525 start_codon:yes stop_codon:yes gene_type:complete